MAQLMKAGGIVKMILFGFVVTSRTVHQNRPGERLAPYAAPGARAWVLLIISALDKPYSF
jgi:hypothetical protein